MDAIKYGEKIKTILMQKAQRPQVKDKSVFICCPFHGESTPSCAVTVFSDKYLPGTFHCFSGKTRVITYEGTKQIRKLSGSKHKILTSNGVWTEAEFKSFGIQQLYKLTVSRNGVVKNIFATKEHEWVVKRCKGKIKTCDLKEGSYLESNAPKFVGCELSKDGIRHGFVFGDGTKAKHNKSSKNYHTKAYLFAHKIDFMLDYFKDLGKPIYHIDRSKYKGGFEGTQIIIDCLPENWKAIPDIHSDDSYIFGFIAGLVAADGCVDKNGTISLHNKNKYILQKVRDLATKIGLATLSITSQVRKGYGKEESPIYRIHFCRGSFPENALLNPEHRHRFVNNPPKMDYLRWKVVSVKQTSKFEEVFCCTVPETHTFTLEDNILTSNCFGCGKSGGWNTLAEKLGLKFRIDNKELAAGMRATVRDVDTDLLRLDSDSVEDFIKSQHFDAYDTWPEGESWRNIDYSFIKAIEAFMIFEFDEQKIFLPVKVNGKLVGGIRASLDRKKYLTTNGNWVKSRGLFPFDVTKKLVANDRWKKKFVVLVEGPRDVARLVIEGIPALAILGSKQWSEDKTNLLMSLIDDDFEVVMIFDSDEAGKEATKLVRENLKGFFKLKKITLPDVVIENGKVSKCDVFNLGKKRFNKLVSALERRYG